MTDLRQRAPRYRDEPHLAFIRLQPCCVCGVQSATEAAHLRMSCLAWGKRECGKGEKPDDKWVTPLCFRHHNGGNDSQHHLGEEVFWKLHGIDPFRIALKYWAQSGGEYRALEVKPPRKPKKIKARKPPARRKRIQPGRKIQSNPVIQSRGFQKREAAE